MLFIFRVDIGTMINLEMNLALETVAHLQTAIASYCNIPVDKQVPRVDLFNITPFLKTYNFTPPPFNNFVHEFNCIVFALWSTWYLTMHCEVLGTSQCIMKYLVPHNALQYLSILDATRGPLTYPNRVARPLSLSKSWRYDLTPVVFLNSDHWIWSLEITSTVPEQNSIKFLF